MATERRERKILAREPKTGKETEGEKKTEGENELKTEKIRKPPAGEIDYGWCDQLELPIIEITFSKGKIIHEKTNYKTIF